MRLRDWLRLKVLRRRGSGLDEDLDSLKANVTSIVARATALKDLHTSAEASVSYSAVFTQSDDEFEALSEDAALWGSLVQVTKTGPVFVGPEIPTIAGPLRIIKIRKPDPTRPERGDADFAVADYPSFKARHLDSPGFTLIERDEFEMLELMDEAFNVRAYFSDPPVEEHSGISEALREAT